MQSALAECLKLAKPATSQQVAQAADKVAQVDEIINRAQQKLENLFGFEASAKPVIQTRIGDLKRERDRLQNLAKYGEYGCLSLEPLKWRDKNKYPRLVVLSLDSPRFELSVKSETRWEYDGRRGDDFPRTRYKGHISPKLPPLINNCYTDVLKNLEAKAKQKKKSIYLATEYVGFIPDETRAKIQDAEKQFKDVFIIAEAKHWSLVEKKSKQLPRPNRGDPLVVGFDGVNLWIVDSFDLTSIERLVKTEFTI